MFLAPGVPCRRSAHKPSTPRTGRFRRFHSTKSRCANANLDSELCPFRRGLHVSSYEASPRRHPLPLHLHRIPTYSTPPTSTRVMARPATIVLAHRFLKLYVGLTESQAHTCILDSVLLDAAFLFVPLPFTSGATVIPGTQASKLDSV